MSPIEPASGMSSGGAPMFPLGSVLFPHMALPLRVFEPRYRRLVADCVAGEGEFGVVLIERGSEVGGGDARFDVGAVARIVGLQELGDGTIGVVAVGLRRVVVEAWSAAPTDPATYPSAQLRDWPDPDVVPADRLERTVARLRTLLARAAEAGDSVVAATVELSPDPEIALWQACSIAPVGSIDDLALLRSPTAAARVELLDRLIDDAGVLVSHRLTGT